MANYIFEIPIGDTQLTKQVEIDKSYIYCHDESYKEDPRIIWYMEDSNIYSYYMVDNCSDISISLDPNPQYDNRFATSITYIQQNQIAFFNSTDWANPSARVSFAGKNGVGSTLDQAYANEQDYTRAYAPNGPSWVDSRTSSIYDWHLATNIPIFETTAEAKTYITTGEGLENAVNYDYLHESDGEDFVINNVWAHANWTPTGAKNITEPNYRLVKGKMLYGSKLSFYNIPGIVDGKLKIGVKSIGEFEGLQYSVDSVNWIDATEFPFDFFYRPRDNELGELDFGLSIYTQIPIFEDEETAQKYMDDDPSVSIEDAVNWPQISNDYPIGNQTGSDLPQTRMGEVKVKGFFSQQYIMDDTCLTALANDFFDTSSPSNIWELIKKGLDMYPNYMDAVMGLSFWPFSLASYLKAGSYSPASYVWLGGYGWDTAGHGSCNRIIYPNGELSIGQFRCIPRFKSWRDFEPYCKMYVSLPYCGTYQLDISRYLGKLIKVKYYIDTRTNGCVACLFADDYLVDFFNGQMGCTMPITMTDFSRFMNSQIETLLGGGGQAVQTFGSGLDIAKTAGSAAGLLGAGATVGVSGAIAGAKTVYGLTQNNINNFHKTKGGSSSMINCYLSQNVDFIFEYQISNYETTSGKSVVATPEYNRYIEMFGLPSMKSGTVGTFSGFLKCQAVTVNAPKATEREKEKIKQMLLSGVYI